MKATGFIVFVYYGSFANISLGDFLKLFEIIENSSTLFITYLSISEGTPQSLGSIANNVSFAIFGILILHFCE